MEEKTNQEAEQMTVGKEKVEEGISFETALQLIPIYTATLLVLEASKQYYYYANFGFNIGKYVNISFLFNSFISSVGTMVVGLISISIYFINLLSLFDIKEKVGPDNLTEDQQKKFDKRKRKFILILMLMLIVGFISGVIYIGIYNSQIVLPALIIFVNTIIIYIIANRYQHVFAKTVKGKIILNYVLMFIYMLVLYVILAFIPAYTLKSKKDYRNIAIQLVEDCNIKPDSIRYPAFSSKYYIGSTPEFYFIYNEKDSTTEVIKAEDVKKVISNNQKLIQSWINK